MIRLIAALLVGCLTACGLPRRELEKQVRDSIRERIGAGKADFGVDSVRLGGRQGSSYAGRVYLSGPGGREGDSIVVKAGLEGLSYEFPEPGPMIARLFR
jgi:hypothetical protein